MTVCKKVHYQGRVQGVGFRYTAHRLAQDFAVAGYVKNLSDGRVELVAEGVAVVVERFLAALANQMAGYIQEETVQDEPPHGFAGFVIRA